MYQVGDLTYLRQGQHASKLDALVRNHGLGHHFPTNQLRDDSCGQAAGAARRAKQQAVLRVRVT